MSRDFPAVKQPCLRDIHSCPCCFEILFCGVSGAVFCNRSCTEGAQGRWCPCKAWGAPALPGDSSSSSSRALPLCSQERPETPGVMEKVLIYDGSTHPSFLLSSHCFPAVHSDCAGTGTLRKSRDGTRQKKDSGSLFTNPSVFCILLYSGQGAQPLIRGNISITNCSHFCCAWNT